MGRKASALKAAKPDIFEYRDVKKFLKDYIEYRKKLDSNFSYRALAIRLNLKSHTHIIMVIRGKQKLSDYMVNKLAAYMKMSPHEKGYFHFINNRTSQDTTIKRLEPKKYGVKDCLYFCILSKLAELDDFQMDSRWVARRTGKLITQKQADRLLRKAVQLGILSKEKGKWKNNFNTLFFMGDTKIVDPLEMQKFSDAMYHHIGSNYTARSMRVFMSTHDAFYSALNAITKVIDESEEKHADDADRRVFAISLCGGQLTRK